MNKSLRAFFSVAVTGLLAAAPIDHAHGQQIKVTAAEPEVSELFSPVFEGPMNKDFKPKEWIHMEAKIHVQMAPEPVTKTCDRLTVKWFLAVENPEKPRTLLLITKDVEHINIPLNEDIYSSAFLSPASILRVLGKSRNVAKMVDYLGYEVVFNGETVAASTNKGKPGWWKVASEKISRTEAVSLLSKPETPFAHLWWDRYAEVDTAKK